MSFFGVVSAILFFLSFVLLRIVLAINPTSFVSGACSSPSFNDNEQFKSNLNTVIQHLISEPPKTGFCSVSVHPNPNGADGIALCRGDVTARNCYNCLKVATNMIRYLCPSYKAAIIWYDDCLLRYSDKFFSGIVEYHDTYSLCSQSSAINPQIFNAKRDDLVFRLASKIDELPKLFVADNALLGSDPIYGLAQCTRDITGLDCRKCVESMIPLLRHQCDGKLGGQVGADNCIVRYETYPFLHT